MAPEIIVRADNGLNTSIKLTPEVAERIAAALMFGVSLDSNRTQETTDKSAEIIVALVTNPPIKIHKP